MKIKSCLFLLVLCVLVAACAPAPVQTVTTTSGMTIVTPVNVLPTPSGQVVLQITDYTVQGGLVSAAVLTFPQTARILAQIANGNAPVGSFIMQIGNEYLFAWPWNGNYAVVTFDQSGFALRHLGDWVRAHPETTPSISRIVQEAESRGGKYINYTEIPDALKIAFSDFLLWVTRIGVTLFEIPVMILPVGTFNPSCIGGCIDG